MNKPKILVCIDWYLPGYKAGGPIRSVANLVQRLDADFWILTSDKDHNSAAPYPNIPTKTWTEGPHGAKVMYLSESEQTAENFAKILSETPFESLYLNSLFSKNFSLLPLRVMRKAKDQRKIVLAPRGMLKTGALSVKATKKKVFLRASKLLGWFKNVRWHATNDTEKLEIEEHYGKKSDIKVAPNLSVFFETEGKIEKSSGSIKLVTIARVSQEKNILGAIQFVGGVADRAGISLDIYGTLQDPEYLAMCEKAAQEALPAKIELKGELPHHKVKAILPAYHFFYLPTLGENFGHAIAEALLCGRPVLISDRTPWRGLEEKLAGFDLPLNAEDFVTKLSALAAMDDLEFQNYVNGAARLGKSIAQDPLSLQANYDLFLF